jgi:divalent metal cation (Fe/Co/Zn/Cd) transporter
VAADHPGTSTVGIAWLALTVATMLTLAAAKRATGDRLSNPVLATEACVTLLDAALASAVLFGVALNATAGWWADPLAALIILAYSIREAHHAWHQAP